MLYASEIGDRIGPFDLALIPIGAYSPRWFMSPFHCSPEDAVDVHRDIKSKQSVSRRCFSREHVDSARMHVRLPSTGAHLC